jgi:hypothetical protein
MGERARLPRFTIERKAGNRFKIATHQRLFLCPGSSMQPSLEFESLSARLKIGDPNQLQRLTLGRIS